MALHVPHPFRYYLVSMENSLIRKIAQNWLEHTSNLYRTPLVPEDQKEKDIFYSAHHTKNSLEGITRFLVSTLRATLRKRGRVGRVSNWQTVHHVVTT